MFSYYVDISANVTSYEKNRDNKTWMYDREREKRG